MEETNKTTEQEQEKTYTQAEVDALLQKEGDRRVSQALKKKQAEFDEAQKLASMSVNEKQEYEYNQRLKALEEREATIERQELVNEAAKQISSKGLPVEVTDFLVGKDAETTAANIKTFQTVFNKAVEQAVVAKLATGAPNRSNVKEGLSKEDFKKMSLQQQAELYKTQPDVYKQLAN